MKLKKRMMVMFVSAVLMILFLGACGNTDSSAGGSADGGEGTEEQVKTKTIKVAFNQPENHPQFKAMEEFGERVYELTDGAYQIEISPNELLGAQRETIELAQSGTIEMSIVAGSLLENFNEDFAVFNLPYVFDSAEHQKAVLKDSDIVGDLYKSIEDQGITVLAGFHGGIRNVYNSIKPIETPEDLQGMKIRVIESDTNIQMMAAMGGTGTPMGQGEVYTAIQSGVLDGGENNELIFANLNHDEIAPYYSYTQHLMFPDYLIVNTNFFTSMPAEHQQIFLDELDKAIDLEFELWDQDVEAAIAAAEEAGAEFNYPDTQLFKDAVQPVIDEKLTTDTAQALYEKVQNALQ
ncbi:TRAP transporter substrate-binding protein [Alkalihalobacillus oceani]|uniref:TRAP transporter substrate-binding protein n=1 Tax=Halalkalibacter oceani TaxID=1653776 RepID=UPI00203B1476|nr:TRAP transporter substrate-binding protein [Halalkalibacter oceani]MCM3761306.1 TRAP transporter substrate-binding protein [Halalkalibacter oceani]